MVDLYKDRVYNTCVSMLHQQEDAEDVAQEVFIEVYKSKNSFRGDAQMSTWIYRIAVNKCLEFLRKKKTKKRWAILLDWTEWKGKEKGDSHSTDHPGIALEQKERAQTLMKAIDKLPENQKVAITLYEFEQLSYKEIAEVMETTKSAIESLIFRAKKNLKKQLHDWYLKEMKS